MIATRFLRFPFNNFRYSLTLFSKFFASFPHGTCLLSVYHLYLALDGVYHLIRAAVPSNSTLQRSNARHLLKARTGVSPSSLYLSRKLCREKVPNVTTHKPQFGAVEQHRFTSWALPTSVALTEGILVSFFSSA